MMIESEGTMEKDQELSPLKERRFKVISLDMDFLIDAKALAEDFAWLLQ